MNKAGYFIIFIIITILGALSCSEEDIVIEDIEPFINVKFINARSLDTLSASLVSVNSQISTITKRIGVIDTITDKSLYLDEKDSLNLVKDSLNVEKTDLSKLISYINRGLAKYTSLQGEGAMQPIPNTDTIGIHQFPFNSNTDQSRFYVTIDVNIDTIEFKYTLDTVFINNKIKVRAYWPDVTYSSFDSVKISCKDSITCTSNDASIIIYF